MEMPGDRDTDHNSMATSRQKNSALISLSNLDVEESFAMTIDLCGVATVPQDNTVRGTPTCGR